MPRPRKSDARVCRLNLRLTAVERDGLGQAAQAAGVRPADYVRRRVLGEAMGAAGAARLSVTVLDPAAVSALNRVGANLNQLARRANAGDLLQPGELPEVLVALSEQLDRIEALVLPALDRAG